MSDNENGQLPNGWALVELQDLVANSKKDIVDGPFGSNLKATEYVNEGIPVFRIQNIKANRFVDENINHVTIEKAEELKRHTFKTGDLIITKLGDPLGLCCEVPKKHEYGVIVADLIRVRLDERRVDKKYLIHAINSPVVQAQFQKITKGTTRPRVNLTIVRGINISLPPLNEQKRIVAKIEELFAELDAGVASLELAQVQLQTYRQALLKHAFEGKLTAPWRAAHADQLEDATTLLQRIQAERQARYEAELVAWKAGVKTWEAKGKPGRKPSKPHPPKDLPSLTPTELADLPQLPAGWAWTRLGNISYDIQYGYTESSSDEPVGPKFLRITDIQNNNVNWHKVPYCPISDAEKSKYLLRPKDIVFARTGATVGKSYLLKGDFPESIFASYLIRVSLSKSISEVYIADFFQSLTYWKQITEGQVGIGQPNVNGTKLSMLIVPLSPFDEQGKLAEEVESRLSVIDQLEQTVITALQQAEALRQSILKKAFAGQLVPQDPNDEPASALLARIRAVKGTAAQNGKNKS